MCQADLQLLVEGMLGIHWSKLGRVSCVPSLYHMVIGSFEQEALLDDGWGCSRIRGASMEKLLALTLGASKDLLQENGKALITIESPKHGSFKSNGQVQAMLQIEGFWVV